MARNPYRRYEVTEYQKEALKFLQPPEDITVSEWADKYRVLDAKTSAMPGPWRTEHTPYLKGIMDEFNNYETEEIVYVKPTQVGGTECLQNMVGYIVQQDPAPTMIVYPTDTLAKSISENRLQPMFKAAPELRKRFDENSQLQELQFDGMYLTLAGSNSPSSLASKAIRYATAAADILGVRTLHLNEIQENEQPKKQETTQYTPEEHWISQNEGSWV
ncbi:phage terminase large subunit family protein [Dorea longicatena]|uniref:Bacteriophage tail assembly protein n=1 Tax=Dorea longicatena TaxID=88431 RepID=A0A173WP28_9FIRM|nr:phage terminase large subunit family protein [Dorea longicatena]CUN41253.1 Bacteriophage tail assembly protein [Dorea longicatena]